MRKTLFLVVMLAAATACGKKAKQEKAAGETENAETAGAAQAAKVGEAAEPAQSVAKAEDPDWVWYCSGAATRSFCYRTMPLCEKQASRGQTCTRYLKAYCFARGEEGDAKLAADCVPDGMICKERLESAKERASHEGGRIDGDCSEYDSWPAGWDNSEAWGSVDYYTVAEAGLKKTKAGAYLLEPGKRIYMIEEGEKEDRPQLAWPVDAKRHVVVRVEWDEKKAMTPDFEGFTVVANVNGREDLLATCEVEPAYSMIAAIMMQTDGRLLLHCGHGGGSTNPGLDNYARFAWDAKAGKVVEEKSHVGMGEDPPDWTRPMYDD